MREITDKKTTKKAAEEFAKEKISDGYAAVMEEEKDCFIVLYEMFYRNSRTWSSKFFYFEEPKNGRKAKKMTEKKEKLLTKSELKEKLQRCCDIMKGCGFPDVSVETYPTITTCNIRGLDSYGDAFVGEEIESKPDIVIPKDGEAVYVRLMEIHFCAVIRVSKGFLQNGKLVCYDISPCKKNVEWSEWRSFSDQNVHSDGWKEEWLKK